jgi:hypothetical protein
MPTIHSITRLTRFWLTVAFVAATANTSTQPPATRQADTAAPAGVSASYGKLPLSFEANHGQADGRVKFLSRTGSYTLFLTGDEAILALRAGKAKNDFP